MHWQVLLVVAVLLLVPLGCGDDGASDRPDGSVEVIDAGVDVPEVDLDVSRMDREEEDLYEEPEVPPCCPAPSCDGDEDCDDSDPQTEDSCVVDPSLSDEFCCGFDYEYRECVHHLVEECAPDCEGRECGPDGCEGFCGDSADGSCPGPVKTSDNDFWKRIPPSDRALEIIGFIRQPSDN